MRLNFLNLSEQIVIERLFNFIPVAYPDLTSIKIQTDQGYIPMAFQTEDLMAKSIDLIHQSYKKFAIVKLRLDQNDNSDYLQIRYIDGSHIVLTKDQDLELVNSHLFPYLIRIKSDTYYYDHLDDAVPCSDTHTSDYLFANQLQLIASAISLEKDEDRFSYHISTLIGDLNQDKLIKILCYCIGLSEDGFKDLRYIRLSTKIDFETTPEKTLLFKIESFQQTGMIDPYKKVIRLD